MSEFAGANPMNEADRMALFIKEKIAQKPCWLKIWAVLELRMIKNLEDPAELKENIKANLGTIAVVGALFGSSNLSSFMSARGVNPDKHNVISFLIGAIRVCAAGSGLLAAVYSAVILTMTNAIPKVSSLLNNNTDISP
jgi:tellurite resistance protein TehA-like permease